VAPADIKEGWFVGSPTDQPSRLDAAPPILTAAHRRLPVYECPLFDYLLMDIRPINLCCTQVDYRRSLEWRLQAEHQMTLPDQHDRCNVVSNAVFLASYSPRFIY